MSVEVETMKREMALRSGKLRDLCVEVDRAEREVGGRRAEQRRAVEGVVAWLEAFERETRDALAAQTRDADAKQAALRQRVAAEGERLGMEKAHVERDAAHVADEFERMEALIEAQTSGDAARRHALSLEKERKDAELEELQRRLAVLSAERDAVSAELGDCDDKIQLARTSAT